MHISGLVYKRYFVIFHKFHLRKIYFKFYLEFILRG